MFEGKRMKVSDCFIDIQGSAALTRVSVSNARPQTFGNAIEFGSIT